MLAPKGAELVDLSIRPLPCLSWARCCLCLISSRVFPLLLICWGVLGQLYSHSTSANSYSSMVAWVSSTEEGPFFPTWMPWLSSFLVRCFRDMAVDLPVGEGDMGGVMGEDLGVEVQKGSEVIVDSMCHHSLPCEHLQNLALSQKSIAFTTCCSQVPLHLVW